MTRRATAVLAALLVVTVGGAPGIAAADAPYADPASVCEGQNQQLVVLLENGETTADELTVFVGTELRFAFCSAESGGNPAETTDAWGVGSVDGLAVEATDNRTVTVEAVGPVDAVDLSQHVEQKAADQTDAPTLTVVEAGGTNASYLDGLGDIRFSDGSNREAFVDARDAYVSAVGNAESLTADLESAADADDPATAVDTGTVTAVSERTAAVDDASTSVEAVFVEAAAGGNEAATGAYFAQREHSTATTLALESAADDYVAAVESQATDARLFATAVLFGPFAAGVLVGVLGGRTISRRDLKQVRRQRRRDRTVEYSLGNLWKVFVGATLAVLAGVAVVAVGAGIGDVLAVIA